MTEQLLYYHSLAWHFATIEATEVEEEILIWLRMMNSQTLMQVSPTHAQTSPCTVGNTTSSISDLNSPVHASVAKASDQQSSSADSNDPKNFQELFHFQA